MTGTIDFPWGPCKWGCGSMFKTIRALIKHERRCSKRP